MSATMVLSTRQTIGKTKWYVKALLTNPSEELLNVFRTRYKEVSVVQVEPGVWSVHMSLSQHRMFDTQWKAQEYAYRASWHFTRWFKDLKVIVDGDATRNWNPFRASRRNASQTRWDRRERLEDMGKKYERMLKRVRAREIARRQQTYIQGDGI